MARNIVLTEVGDPVLYVAVSSQDRTHAANFSQDPVYVAQDAEDQLLVRRCLAGDAGGFEAIVARYQRVFFTVALRILGDHDESSDAVQNTFIKIYDKLATFDSSRRFFSWAYRVLVNECLNARRARRPHEPITVDLPAVGTPLETLERDERRRHVQAALLALSLEHREVVVLRHFAGLSYEEIGEALHLPVATVKSRLYSARQRLAQMLQVEAGHD
jgi:RNA polymerase sigma-70 factor, ECF subfamily